MSATDTLAAHGVVPAASYIENYKILAEAARELREQEDVDIDRLVPMVDKALAAYAACKGRIDAVQALLAERLGGDENSRGMDDQKT